MLAEKLKGKTLVLASGSPRRQNFFKELGVPFTIDPRPVDESFDPTLQGTAITDYLAQKKASAFKTIPANTIIVTSDTIVWHQDKALNKPENATEAFAMIESLSGKTHKVMTSVCFTTATQQVIVNDTTKVTIKTLSPDEINYYITHFQPYDKAGGYGVQEWFGYIAVTHIEGSYFNVMGLPMHKVYKTLIQLANCD